MGGRGLRRFPEGAGVVRSRHQLRPARLRALRSGGRRADARGAHGRRARGDGRRGLGAGGPVRDLRGRADEHPLRRHLPGPRQRAGVQRRAWRARLRTTYHVIPSRHPPRRCSSRASSWPPSSLGRGGHDRGVGSERADDGRRALHQPAWSVRAPAPGCSGHWARCSSRSTCATWSRASTLSALVLHRRHDRLVNVRRRALARRAPAERAVVELARRGPRTLVRGTRGEGPGRGKGVPHRHRYEPDLERILATVLFTDIVDSTDHGGGLGDQGWREVLDATGASCASLSGASGAAR